MKDSVSSTVLVLRTVLGMVCASTVTAILFLEVFTGIDLHPSMIIDGYCLGLGASAFLYDRHNNIPALMPQDYGKERLLFYNTVCTIVAWRLITIARYSTTPLRYDTVQ